MYSCARENSPGIYQRTSGFFDWIVSEVCPSSPGADFCNVLPKSVTPSPTISPTPSPTACTGPRFKLVFDVYGAENSRYKWEVVDERRPRRTLLSGGPYENGATYQESGCLDTADACYILTVKDSKFTGLGTEAGYTASFEGRIFVNVVGDPTKPWSEKSHQFGDACAPTEAPSAEPSISVAPSEGPTPIPCFDDDSWVSIDEITGQERNCSWVANATSVRCSTVVGVDQRLASDACYGACETSCPIEFAYTKSPSEEPSSAPSSIPSDFPSAVPTNCEDDTTWYTIVRRRRTGGCDYISEDPESLCTKEGTDGTGRIASDACPFTCGVCS
jgi:hypothetical protein